jgi:hypothetical protein
MTTRHEYWRPSGLDREEITGHDPLRLRAQKLRPGRPLPPGRRPQAMLAKERPDRGRTDPNPELVQLALDPDAAPARIPARQAQHQLP